VYRKPPLNREAKCKWAQSPLNRTPPLLSALQIGHLAFKLDGGPYLAMPPLNGVIKPWGKYMGNKPLTPLL
jgi:hypothetical protein